MSNEKSKTKEKNPVLQDLSTPKIEWKFWSKLWEVLKPFHRSIYWIMTLVLFMEIGNLIVPYFFKLIIDRLVNFKASDLPILLFLVGISFVVNSVLFLLHNHRDRKIFNLNTNLDQFLSTKLEDKLIHLPLDYHEKENTGNKISKTSRGVDRLIDMAGNVAWEFAPTIFQLILTGCILFYLAPQLAVVFLITMPLFLIITFRMQVRLNPLRRKSRDLYENASGKLGQSIFNIYTVQSFVQEDNEKKEYTTLQNDHRTVFNERNRLFLRYNLLRLFLNLIGRIGTLLFAIYLAYDGNISLGTLVYLITVADRSYNSLFRLSRIYDQIIESSTAAERIVTIIEEPTTLPNNPIKKLPKNLIGTVDFKNVFFHYSSREDQQVLHDINFEIKPGEKIALIGPSGGGKSTIIKLLYRHYDPTDGKILVDGNDIRAYDLYDYRRKLAIVPQEVEIFNGTIKENIAYGRRDATDEQIAQAARIANADEFIDAFTDGYETMVGERGMKLSGGQRQRIGIARAILPDPKILIFDEATSNLDTRSERLIQKAIQTIGQDRTMIIIAHRLSTIANVDKIIVISDGKVVENGTHAELINHAGGLYRNLLKLQDTGDVH